jgi:hypothetical protein
MRTTLGNVRWLIFSLSGTLLFFISGMTSQAATYYTATTGSDSNPGTIEKPFKTIVKGIHSMRAGDTLRIRGGTYPERLHHNERIVFPSGTSWTNAVTIVAYPGETVILRPGSGGSVVSIETAKQYIIFDRLIFDAINAGSESTIGIMGGANHIRFQNCEIKNSFYNGVMIGWGGLGVTSDYNEFINCIIHHSGRYGGAQINGVNVPGPDTAPGFGRGHGMYIETSYNLVRNCNIHSNGEYGLKFYYGDPKSGRRANHNTIRDSVLYNNAQNTTRYGHPIGGGILLATGVNNRAINNIVYNTNVPDPYVHGIDTGYTGTDALIYNNTIYNVGLGIQVTATSTNAIIKNNIIYKTTHLVTEDRGVGTTWSNNLIDIDPRFVDRAAGNFRLESNSPAINQGATLPEVETDILGVPRPQEKRHDIGAYEFRDGSDRASPNRPAELAVK